ncbi:MAG: nucleotidyltransferase family protein [Mongoliibacter sp.]|nr:MAG: nucleotidyltransferase family protein [Mongoliibacter sp.]
MKMAQTGIIILAAGNSSRLGQAKQLVEYQGENLLQHSINVSSSLGEIPSVIVLGANHEKIVDKIELKGFSIVINPDWKKGMSISMQVGLKYLLEKNKNLTQVLLLLCDQPFVNEQLLTRLMDEKDSSKKGIACCAYANTIGVPVVFDQKYFDALFRLTSQEGAKKVILTNKEDVAIIDFPEGAVDIDTQEDLMRLKNYTL